MENSYNLSIVHHLSLHFLLFLRQIIVKYFKRSKLIFQKIIAKDIINNTINVAKILKEKKKERKRSYWNETIQTIVKDEDKRQTQFKKKKEKKMNRNQDKEYTITS